MARTDDFTALLARLTIPAAGSPAEGGEAAAVAAFDDRYARYRTETDAMMAANRRSAFDLVSPPPDHRPLANRIAAWLGECAAFGQQGAVLAAAGRPALQARVDAATADATNTLAVVGTMAGNTAAAAAEQAAIAATARADALTTIGRLSDELAAATNPLDPGH